MKGILMKYFLILCMLILSSCSKTEEPKVVALEPPKPVPPVDQGIIKDQEVVKDQELPVKDQEVKRASFPGYECEKFFPQDAIKKADASGEIYIAEHEYIVLQKDVDYVSQMRIGYIPQAKTLHLFISAVGKKRICYEKESPLLISLLIDDETDDRRVYELKGIHKANCGNARKVQDSNKAVSMYELPVDTYFFQIAQFKRTLGFVHLMDPKKETNIMYEHFNVNSSLAFMNGLRCAYSAMGYTSALPTDNLKSNRWRE